MKIKSLEVLSAITIPGAIGGDTSLNGNKQPGIKLNLMDNVVIVEYKGQMGAIPLSNIRVMVLEGK